TNTRDGQGHSYCAARCDVSGPAQDEASESLCQESFEHDQMPSPF
uniref:Uncharacterized protein n=1 Tax=Salvator merianae TaxID=96440 RepID=A0A8D0C625_SALMN